MGAQSTVPTLPPAASALPGCVMPIAGHAGSIRKDRAQSVSRTSLYVKSRAMPSSYASSTLGTVRSVGSRHVLSMQNHVPTAGGGGAPRMPPRARSVRNGPFTYTSAHARHAWLAPAHFTLARAPRAGGCSVPVTCRRARRADIWSATRIGRPALSAEKSLALITPKCVRPATTSSAPATAVELSARTAAKLYAAHTRWLATRAPKSYAPDTRCGAISAANASARPTRVSARSVRSRSAMNTMVPASSAPGRPFAPGALRSSYRARRGLHVSPACPPCPLRSTSRRNLQGRGWSDSSTVGPLSLVRAR